MNKNIKENYKTRLIDPIIDKYLEIFGAICIEGPKWCGKTWTSSYHSKSEFFVGDPNNNFSNRNFASIEPYKILEGEKPRLIDEWQEVPSIWDTVRAFVDAHPKKGQIILTGSSTPLTKGVLHSGTGRIASLKMNTMSLFESGDSTGEISLTDLLNDKFQSKIIEHTSLEKLAYLIIRGGWPGNLNVSNNYCDQVAKNYIENVIKTDLNKLNDDTLYNQHKAKLILKSLARNESTTVSNQTILNDIDENDNSSMSKNTLSKYIDAFDRIFLFNNQEPYSSNVRSSLRVKQNEKRHFCDPSLAASLLNLNIDKLLNDLNTFGFLFESLVIRDLSIYTQTIEGKLFHYQDYKDNEIDAIIELNSGDTIAIEIKLGLNQAEKASNNLIKICSDIKRNGGKEPAYKIIIYGVGNAMYRDKNGVYIIPITALKN